MPIYLSSPLDCKVYKIKAGALSVPYFCCLPHTHRCRYFVSICCWMPQWINKSMMKWSQITQKHFQVNVFRGPNASFSWISMASMKTNFFWNEHHKLDSPLKDRTEASEQMLLDNSRNRQQSQHWPMMTSTSKRQQPGGRLCPMCPFFTILCWLQIYFHFGERVILHK